MIAYDGSAYFGFQKQTETSQTVVSSLENALYSLGIDAPVIGSGRTDTGVHASGQVIHFDLPLYWNDLERLKTNLNRKLHEIRVKHICKTDDDFHARFDAKKRIYRYVFKTKTPSVFEQKYISAYAPFDASVLVRALKLFEGKHDFAFFHKSGSDTHTTVREVYQTRYLQRDGYHFIYFIANGFLRSQVRMMVQSAMACAKREMTIDALKEQLACIKKHNHRLAPPQGLYLARVIY